MKKQLSSLDIHFLSKELKILENSKADKIYQPDRDIILFSLYKTNEGKKLLKINVGKSIFISQEKEDYGETLNFGMLLRKHLDGYFLNNIEQIEPERIIKLSFKIRNERKNMYIEFFGKGNLILCNDNDIIINSLEQHEFKDRTIKPKVKYDHPIMKYNIFNIGKSQLMELFKFSKKDSLVTSLAVELGLGGVYSEEICLMSRIDKNKSPKHLGNDEIELISDSIQKIINKKIGPQVLLQDNNPIDVVPFDLDYYQRYQKKSFSTFNEALSFFYSHFKEAKETEFDKKLKNLQRIIEEQKHAIGELKKDGEELREKGELIYHHYALIKEILEEINKASKKYGWKDVKEKLKEHKIIKEVNEKERKIIVEI